MDDTKKQEWIEAYLNGELKGEELQKIEQKLQTDTEFATEVAQNKDLETMLTSFEIENWRQHAKKILEEKKAKPTPSIKPIKEAKPRNNLKYLWRVAAVLFLIAGLTYLFVPRQSVAPEQLAMTYFEQTESSIYSGIERGENPVNADDQLLNTAHQQYQEHNYQQVITTLTKVSIDSPFYPESTLLSGLCYMHLNQQNQAIQNFQTVTTHPNTLSQEEAEWLLALAYLQKGEIETAKKQLQTIQRAKGGFSKQATALLGKL